MSVHDRPTTPTSPGALAGAALAALLVALPTADAAAQPAVDRYTARLARPAPVASVTVGGVAWSCESVSCMAESDRDLVHVKACEALASEVGRIVAFGRSGGRELDASLLETCNDAAGVGAGGDGEAGGRDGGGDAAGDDRGGDGGAIPVAPVTEKAAEQVARRAGDIVRADPSDAEALTEPEPFVYYKIRNRSSGKPAAVSGGHIRNGASVIQWSDRDQPDVFWRAIPAGDDLYKLKNRNSGRFLAVSGGKRDDGQNVIQWDDDDQGDVHWRFEPAGDGHVKIRNAATGKVLIVPEGMREDGANIVQWQDVDRPHARWRLQPAADIRMECDADRSVARRVGRDTRPDLEVQDIQIKGAKVRDGDVVLLRVEALIRNRSEGTWRGPGKYAFVHESGANRLIRPGSVGALLDAPVGPGETVRVSDLFVLPREQRRQLDAGRFMKAVFTGGASEAGNAVRAVRAKYLDDDGEPTTLLEEMMRDGADAPPELLPLFPAGQRQTIQVQLEPVEDRGSRWTDDLRLCNNFLQLSFVVDDRGVAKRFRFSQKGPDSYRDFHSHRVPVSGD